MHSNNNQKYRTLKNKVILVAICLIVAVNCTAQNSDTNYIELNKSLVLYCPFDEDGKDTGPNAYHALLNGAIISDNAVIGNGCIYFDGINDYVQFPSDRVYFNGEYSISIWCYWESHEEWMRILDFNHDVPQKGNAITWLLGRKDEPDSKPMWFDQWISYDDKIVESIIDFERNNPSDGYLGYNVKLKSWEHYVIVYDTTVNNSLGIQVNTKSEDVPLSGKVYLYVNGKKQYETEYCLQPQEIPTQNNWLGRSAYKFDPYYHGMIDEFRIYSRKLNKNEIDSLYNEGKCIKK